MNQPKKKPSLDSMHRRTVTLEKAAGDLGDDFLQYLYQLARIHIEERAGIRHEELLETPSSEDSDVAEPDD
jgi:hypothetical protein